MSVVDLAAAGTSPAGGKAVALGRLLRAGFRVPAGFVVTADAYRAMSSELRLDELGADSAALRSRILRPQLPTRLVDDISRALARLTDGASTDHVAVRSSATTEDGPAASTAGQHDSFLAVRGTEQMCLAIRRCWASLWTERAVSYRARSGTTPEDGGIAMAVLVQRFVDAEVSGVMFTGTTSVIEASWGLGAPIVAGHVTPDLWRVSDAGILGRRAGSKTRRTDRSGDELVTWVLQARPVTASVAEPSARAPTAAGDAVAAGVPASPGTATGTVRTVSGPSDFRRVEPGDVLVCRDTDPAWTPLFSVASAVVTETGGVRCHAAIVAREVGIPAVLSVPDATTTLVEPSTVTVDGDAGVVVAAPRGREA